jgi:hypothetical protein
MNGVRFDDFWEDEDGETPVGDDLPKAPDGRHAGEIVDARIKDLKFKVSDRNRMGTSLVVKVDLGKYQPVEAIVPVQYRGLVEAICRAARVDLPAKGETWQPDVLVGRQVQVETVLGVAKSGNEFIRIDKWHAGPETVPAAIKAAPRRTPAAKVEAVGQGGSPDDIPF